MNVPPPGRFTGRNAPLPPGLDARSAAVLREIVEQYVETGEPVGSRTLSRRLPTMIRATLESQQQETVLPITGKFAASRQRALTVEIMKAIGFPFDRGRLDESEHRILDCHVRYVRKPGPFPPVLAATYSSQVSRR